MSQNRPIFKTGAYIDKLAVARGVAFSLLNKPYIWGGNTPAGYDCSGLVIEILKSIGLLPEKGDWTAHGLYSYFRTLKISESDMTEGCLIFWDNEHQIVNHVEYALSPTLSIGARGGSRHIKTATDALKYGAYSKIRPWKNREGRHIRALIDPFYQP